MYKPKEPFNVGMRLLVPTLSKNKGVVIKTYPSVDDAPLILGSFKTFGSQEVSTNELGTNEDTGVIDTWYREDITADCRIYIIDNQKTYEVDSTPENISMRNQIIQFRVKAVGGIA